MSFEISPSAQCMLELDHQLGNLRFIYGFQPFRIEPSQIVFIEDMIHFAPQHAERLRWFELTSGHSFDVYPAQGDPLRARFIAMRKRQKVSKEDCAKNNDSCDPLLFDETLSDFWADGHGVVAFLAEHRDANHTQNALYIYVHQENGWRYCAVPVRTADIADVKLELSSGLNPQAMRCDPSTPVVPDLSTASQNPFADR